MFLYSQPLRFTFGDLWVGFIRQGGAKYVKVILQTQRETFCSDFYLAKVLSMFYDFFSMAKEVKFAIKTLLNIWIQFGFKSI